MPAALKMCPGIPKGPPSVPRWKVTIHFTKGEIKGIAYYLKMYMNVCFRMAGLSLSFWFRECCFVLRTSYRWQTSIFYPVCVCVCTRADVWLGVRARRVWACCARRPAPRGLRSSARPLRLLWLSVTRTKVRPAVGPSSLAALSAERWRTLRKTSSTRPNTPKVAARRARSARRTSPKTRCGWPSWCR